MVWVQLAAAPHGHHQPRWHGRLHLGAEVLIGDAQLLLVDLHELHLKVGRALQRCMCAAGAAQVQEERRGVGTGAQRRGGARVPKRPLLPSTAACWRRASVCACAAAAPALSKTRRSLSPSSSALSVMVSSEPMHLSTAPRFLRLMPAVCVQRRLRFELVAGGVPDRRGNLAPQLEPLPAVACSWLLRCCPCAAACAAPSLLLRSKSQDGPAPRTDRARAVAAEVLEAVRADEHGDEADVAGVHGLRSGGARPKAAEHAAQARSSNASGCASARRSPHGPGTPARWWTRRC